MTSKMMYDYIVLGAGSGGIASARRAASYGMKVAVVESGPTGGTCVNVGKTCDLSLLIKGCVPKKVMFNTAAIAESLRDARGYGFDVTVNGFSWETIKTKRDAYVKRLNGIYESNLQKDTIELIRGTATFVSKDTITVNGLSYTAKQILIATGSSAVIPDIPGAKEYGMTSDGFFLLESLPKKVAVVGAGYIAVELAGIMRALGSEVTLFIRQEEFLRSFDEIIRRTIMQEYEAMGIKIVRHSKITAVENLAKDVEGTHGSLNPLNKINLTVETNGVVDETLYHDYTTLLFAVGRDANVHALNLPVTCIALNENGFINFDEYQRTNVDGILALGDVCGFEMLTPVAIAAGRHLSDRLFGGKSEAKLDYANIPSVIFSHPVSASVGITEAAAILKHGAEHVKCYRSKFTNMYFFASGLVLLIGVMLDHKEPTVYKLVCVGKEEKIVGIHMVGRSSDEIMQGFSVAMKMGATKRDFDSTVAIHPTAAEELVTMK